MILVAINQANQQIYESLSYNTYAQKQIVKASLLADAERDGVRVHIVEMETDKEVENYILSHS